ncbi:MAG: hypothetical protein WCN88_01845 [Candidatus Falkowbacteria bacterium]
MSMPSVHASEGQILADEINQEKARLNDVSKLTQLADSLGIFSGLNNQYYVYCKVCPVQTSNGFLVMAIIDTLKFIDPNIPQNKWVNAYVSKNYTYNWVNQMGIAKIERQRLTINSRRDETRALLVGDSLKSFTILNVQQCDATEARRNGNLLLIVLLIWGLVVGAYVFTHKSLIVKFLILTLAFFVSTLFIRSLIDSTLVTLSVMLGTYLLGNLLILLIFRIFFAIRLFFTKRKKNFGK